MLRFRNLSHNFFTETNQFENIGQYQDKGNCKSGYMKEVVPEIYFILEQRT